MKTKFNIENLIIPSFLLIIIGFLLFMGSKPVKNEIPKECKTCVGYSADFMQGSKQAKTEYKLKN